MKLNFFLYQVTRRFFLTVFLYCIQLSVFAQPIVLKNEQEISSLGSSLSYYIQEANENYTIEEVSKPNFDKKWLTSPSEHLSLGYLSLPIWLKVEISNQSQLSDWQFVLDMPFTDSVGFYKEVTTNSFEHTQTGWILPYHSRGKMKHNGFVFPLELLPNEKTVFYLRIRSNYPVLLPISISTKDVVIENTQDSHIAHGIYFGLLLVMILYNFVIYLVTRDLNYLYYVLTVVFTFLTFAGISGYMFKYVYPDFPEANVYYTRSTMAGAMVVFAIFAIHFLQLKKHFIWLYRLFIGLIIAAFISYPINFTIWGGAINAITKVEMFVLLAVGIYCWYKGNKYARFFVLAWSLYMIGGVVMTLRNSGSLPINIWTNTGAYIGSALEVILISIALADRYRVIRKEKDIATKKALKLEQQTSQELETKVNERTTKLNESNEELAQTNEELSVTLEVVGKQKTQIESKNKDITDSINYAKRIQDALLPSQSVIQSSFTDSFTLYLPKDVVSGDFYFFIQNDNNTFLAVADCTGHGVPGSLMSMIGTNLLRESILEKKMILPSEILMNLHKEIVTTLKQKETGNRDGMDISLCIVNKSENKIYFSGAKNTLVAIKGEEIKEYKGSKFSIGGSVKTEGITFGDEIIEIDNKTSYYMYSDGYQDQFGGEKNKKFMRKNLKNLLQTIHKLPFEEQKQILHKTIIEWQEIGNDSQIDDILVMGFKV
jgi:serine phosphatase RsbU (regulator of sigma subunit)